MRYRLTPYIDAIGTYLDEGDARVVKRKGGAGQLGIKREFLNYHADVGVAGGFYFARNSDYNGPPTDVLGLVTTRTQVLGPTNGRDTDVVMGGIVYAF